MAECVKQRKKNGRHVGTEIDAPLDIDLPPDTGSDDRACVPSMDGTQAVSR